RLRDRLGNYRWQLARALPLRAADGRIIQWFATSTDIEDKKRAEQQLASLLESEKKARLQAETAVRDREDILAVVSHDLRSPLTSIMLKGELLQQLTLPNGPEASQVRQAAGVIHRAAHRMGELIQNLLDIAAVES